MKQLEAPYLYEAGKETPIEEVSELLDKLDKHSIDQVPWPEYPSKAQAKFALAHSHDCLFLKFYVTEEHIRATYSHTNDPVYKDSCVEMFLSFNDENEYYNIEFNLLGTCMAGYGAGRENRQKLSKAVIEEKKTYSQVKNKHNDQAEYHWQLTLMIPLNFFCMHTLGGLKGIKTKANFFKCGDELPEPHFLAWNPITYEKPEFHLPAFFGSIHFV